MQLESDVSAIDVLLQKTPSESLRVTLQFAIHILAG